MSFFNFKIFSNNTQKTVHRKTTDYKLLEKTEHKNIAEIGTIPFNIPENIDSFTRVVIGKNSDENYKQEILSFYDKNKELIARFRTGTNMPTRRKLYSTAKGTNSELESLNIRLIKTQEYNPESIIWKDISDEIQSIKKESQKNKGVFIQKNTYLNNNDILVNIGEYYAPKKLSNRCNTKRVETKINKDKDLPQITDIKTENVNLPIEEDNFLAYRLLQGKEKQEALTKYYLNKKGLSNAGIKVKTTVSKDKQKELAAFSNNNSSINFNEIVDRPAAIAAHEVAHAYQHKLIGQLGEGTSDYEKRCRQLYGKLYNPEQIEEAKKYKEASDLYPGKSKIIQDCIPNNTYKTNYLEIKSKQEEKIAEEEYNKGKTFWHNQFKLSPKNKSF